MSPASDDDLLPGLPALDGGDDDGVTPGGLDDEDTNASDDESVGLDTEVGTNEDAEDEVDGDEAQTWTTDADESPELDDGDEDFGPEDAGWTDDEAASLEDDDEPDEPESTSLISDRGEEGVDDDPARRDTEDALDDAPPGVANEASTTADEDLDDPLFAEAAEGPWNDESNDDAEQASFAPEPGVTLRVEHLGPGEEAVACVASDAMQVLAGGMVGLYRARYGHPLELRAEESDGEGVTTVVIASGNAGRIAIGTRLAGVLTSTDEGITFDSANSWQRHARDVEIALFVAGEPSADGTRLWARTRSGVLYRSDDFGASWSAPVLLAGVRALAVDPEGSGVAALVASRGAAHLAGSRDGGARWSMRAVPIDPARALAIEGELVLAMLGEVLALAHPDDPAGVHLSLDGGATWIAEPSLRGACALALVREGEGVVLYAGITRAGMGDGFVVRRGPGGVSTLILDVAVERRTRSLDGLADPDGEQRIFALEVRVDADVTRVLAATGAGLFRIDRSTDGS
jgi:hypothetical protein